jgi:hypothetical protein
MATSPQILANRQNAQHSTGPLTDAGKQRAALNATRHGFTGQSVVLTAEEAERYTVFMKGMLKDLAPVGTHETQLAHSIIDARWRLNQIAALESGIYALGHREHADRFKDETPDLAAALIRAQTFTTHQKELDRLHRYESRLHRQAAKDLAAITTLQTPRKAYEAQKWKDAVALFKRKQKDGEAWNPADFGFVWSLEQIERAIDRSDEIRAAHAYDPNDYFDFDNSEDDLT